MSDKIYQYFLACGVTQRYLFTVACVATMVALWWLLLYGPLVDTIKAKLAEQAAWSAHQEKDQQELLKLQQEMQKLQQLNAISSLSPQVVHLIKQHQLTLLTYNNATSDSLNFSVRGMWKNITTFFAALESRFPFLILSSCLLDKVDKDQISCSCTFVSSSKDEAKKNNQSPDVNISIE